MINQSEFKATILLDLCRNDDFTPRADPTRGLFTQHLLRYRLAETPAAKQIFLARAGASSNKDIRTLFARAPDVIAHLGMLIELDYFKAFPFDPKAYLDLKKGNWMVRFPCLSL